MKNKEPNFYSVEIPFNMCNKIFYYSSLVKAQEKAEELKNDKFFLDSLIEVKPCYLEENQTSSVRG